MPQQNQGSSPYGPAGGGYQSRFEILNDPREAIIINCAGSMYSTRPGHLLGLDGATYRYTPGYASTNGLINLVTGEGYLSSIPVATTYDTIDHKYVYQSPVAWSYYTQSGTPNIMLAGNPHEGTTGESFTVAGTVSTTIGSETITGAGTNFTTATVAGYPYTSSFINPAPGDVITIAGAEYVITQIVDATHLKVFPVAVSTLAAQAYTIKRYGFASKSRVIPFPTGSGATTYLYHTSNQFQTTHGHDLQPLGTIGATLEGTTAAHTTAPVYATSGLNVKAYDIALYKSFLLFGHGGSISWSNSAFPLTLPFDAADFPDINITVVDPSDTFVGFEYLGDQLVALFRRGIWLIVPTGSVPEFNFYKMPENRGCHDPAVNVAISGNPLYIVGRPHCSAPGAVYYVAEDGIIEFTGSLGKTVSGPIDDLLTQESDPIVQLFWDQPTDSIIVARNGTNQNIYVYSRKTGGWSIIQTGVGTGNFMPAPIAGLILPNQAWRFGWIDQVAHTVVRIPPTVSMGVNSDTAHGQFPTLPWQYTSPIFNVSDVYSKYQFGGFSIDAHGDPAQTTPSLSWSVLAGTNPYNLMVEDSGTYDYTYGTTSSRDILSKKIDKPYLALKMSGSSFIKLSRLAVYATTTSARR